MTTRSEAPAAHAVPTDPGRRRRLLVDAERFALPLLVVVVCVLFASLPASRAAFASIGNIQAVLGNVSVVSILAVAAIFPLVAGHFDFTIGATAALSSIGVAATMSHARMPLLVAVVFGVALGLAVGLVNAFLVAVLHLNAFIVTIGGATLIPGLISWYTGGVDIVQGIDPALARFGAARIGVVPLTFVVVLIIAVVAWLVLARTVFGRQVAAAGANANAARLMGMRVDRLSFISFLISGALAGVAGVLLTARNGGGMNGAGVDLLFPALAAVFLGATAIDPGRFNVWGTLVGTFFVAVAVSGLTLAGAASWVPAVFNGTALILAVAVSTAMARMRKRAA